MAGFDKLGRRQYGIGGDYVLTPCDAKPENYGKYPCYHHGHVIMSPEEAEKENEALFESQEDWGVERRIRAAQDARAEYASMFTPVSVGGGAWALDHPHYEERFGPRGETHTSGGGKTRAYSHWRVAVGGMLPVVGQGGRVQPIRVTTVEEVPNSEGTRWRYTGLPYYGLAEEDIHPNGEVKPMARQYTKNAAAWISVGVGDGGKPEYGAFVSDGKPGDIVTIVSKDGRKSKRVLGGVRWQYANGCSFYVKPLEEAAGDGGAKTGRWAKHGEEFCARVDGGREGDTAVLSSASGKATRVRLGAEVPGSPGVFAIAERLYDSPTWKKDPESGAWSLVVPGGKAGDIVEVPNKDGVIRRYLLMEPGADGSFQTHMIDPGRHGVGVDAAGGRQGSARRKGTSLVSEEEYAEARGQGSSSRPSGGFERASGARRRARTVFDYGYGGK